jgi:pimeloyl-ACP methyl ester carboxylesterase
MGVTKVIVAVHGVGDQYSFATIQSVVNQFCYFRGEPAAVPLGRFHTGEAPFSICPPFPPGTFDHLAFAEVYWARIPRELVDDEHTMEEAKKWAATLVERVRLSRRQSSSPEKRRNGDLDRIKLILDEMIETLAVVERLCYLADRAGLFSFNLRKLLDDYLGDVQIVAEFDSQRRKILDAFADTMAQVHKANRDAEIFVIAHSEGTVISFLGLLEAGSQPDPPAWLGRVRGLMTLGSPIDKHLILWPTLFPSRPPSPRLKLDPRIQWRNYYDEGDPIGFELEGAREWITAKGWDRMFSFSAGDDFGFVRYPFPGKAHVDYWNDREVFGHFIETVVGEIPPTPRTSRQKREGPPTLQLKKWLSYVLPYVGLTALLLVGVFILYKAVINATEPDRADDFRVMVHLVTGVTLMLLGITVASRIPRLTGSVGWSVFAGILGLGLAFLALWIGEGAHAPQFLNDFSNTFYLVGCLGLVVVITIVSGFRPQWGIKPLIALGTLMVATFVAYGFYQVGNAQGGTIWPVFLATAAFFYLWWLAALLFDLVFVWHTQIRTSKADDTLARLAGQPEHRREKR